MAKVQRLPAIPLIANDPYFSIWMPADTLTDGDSIHWSGPEKNLYGSLIIDGKSYRFLGKSPLPPMETIAQKVTPTKTIVDFLANGVALTLTFWTPTLPDDLDTLSTPVTFVDFALSSVDGKTHEVAVTFSASTALCYDGEEPKPLWVQSFRKEDLSFILAGQKQQNLLGHSADHITMDWGYLYLASGQAKVAGDEKALVATWEGTVDENHAENFHIQLGYDDVASILYFGFPCKAWYARKGKSLPDAMIAFEKDYNTLKEKCTSLDQKIIEEALHVGGEAYQLLVSISWRHTFSAHKLIVTPQGEMAWISKENDSNGCMCTVDISYPSVPVFLKYQPELVNAMCRPVLHFASLPVWDEDFAPHDIGRYPIANGQVYALRLRKESLKAGDVAPPVYLYPSGSNVYDIKYQMPIEECGNMIIMLAALAQLSNDSSLAKAHRSTLAKWVKYLEEYGEDPGEQLCTDDFAGHLAHNVNLSAKAIVGIACYGKLLEHFGEDGSYYTKKAKEMAKSWYERAYKEEGYTALTFKGIGWSQKYNLVWDTILDLGLFPSSFYQKETESYLSRINTYGLPLDSRKTYTKSDWIVWSATMAQDKATFEKLIAPLVTYLEETPSRVPYSDWFDTVTGAYEHFIGRSVQGGMFMPMLRKDWKK